MMEKEEMLHDEELDKIVGGADYTKVSYRQEGGKYYVTTCSFKGDGASWNAFLQGAAVDSLNASVSVSHGVVSGDKWGKYSEMLQKRFGDSLVMQAIQ